jgi:hypothetical protein
MKLTVLPAALLTAAIAAAPLAALADNDWGQHRGGNYSNFAARAQGTIAETRGSMLRMDDGRPVYLHRGTVINPTGITLRPGMRISVSGSPGGNGGINADVIDVAQRGYNSGNWNGAAFPNQRPYPNQNGGPNSSVPDHSESR